MTLPQNATERRPRFAPPTFDGDTRRLVTRCAARGVPVGVVSDGELVIVRSLAELDQLPDAKETRR